VLLALDKSGNAGHDGLGPFLRQEMSTITSSFTFAATIRIICPTFAPDPFAAPIATPRAIAGRQGT